MQNLLSHVVNIFSKAIFKWWFFKEKIRTSVYYLKKYNFNQTTPTITIPDVSNTLIQHMCFWNLSHMRKCVGVFIYMIYIHTLCMRAYAQSRLLSLLCSIIRYVYIYTNLVCWPSYLHRGSNMSAHILLNLLNELWKRDKLRGWPSSLSLFRNEFNKLKNTGVRILDSIYLMTLKLNLAWKRQYFAIFYATL